MNEGKVGFFSVAAIAIVGVMMSLAVLLTVSGCAGALDAPLLEVQVFDGEVPGTSQTATFRQLSESSVSLDVVESDPNRLERVHHAVISQSDYDEFLAKLDSIRGEGQGTLVVNAGLADMLRGYTQGSDGSGHALSA